MSAPSDRPIFLCYDGSEDSAGAIQVAGVVLGGGEALVCHSWVGLSRLVLRADANEFPGPISEASDEFDAASADQAEKLAAEGAELALAAGFSAQPVTAEEHGDTWRTLLATAERHHARVIVVGAHGAGGVKRILLGSVSNALVHHSPIPVLVVRPPGDHELPTAGPLLLCYDRSDNAKHAIATAGQLFPGREAVVLHLWESWVSRAPAMAGGSVHGMAVELDHIADVQSTEIRDDGLAVAQAAGLDARPLSARADGPLWRSVLEAAAECDASAIVMGSRGMTGISAVLGSVSHGVVHHSHRPVLIVPPEAKQG